MIPIEIVLEMQANHDEVVIIDVLDEDEFGKGHLPGAVNLPLKTVANEASERFAKDDTIVVYCGSYTCKASTLAAEKLVSLGFSDVLDYKAGKKGWTDAGFELEN
jgi:rhodanese-related sulfurtransferase